MRGAVAQQNVGLAPWIGMWRGPDALGCVAACCKLFLAGAAKVLQVAVKCGDMGVKSQSGLTPIKKALLAQDGAAAPVTCHDRQR